MAQDADDATRGNGPPFVFAIDPAADDVLKASFKVDNIPSMCQTICLVRNTSDLIFANN